MMNSTWRGYAKRCGQASASPICAGRSNVSEVAHDEDEKSARTERGLMQNQHPIVWPRFAATTPGWAIEQCYTRDERVSFVAGDVNFSYGWQNIPQLPEPQDPRMPPDEQGWVIFDTSSDKRTGWCRLRYGADVTKPCPRPDFMRWAQADIEHTFKRWMALAEALFGCDAVCELRHSLDPRVSLQWAERET